MTPSTEHDRDAYRARLAQRLAELVDDLDPSTVTPAQQVTVLSTLVDSGLAAVTWPVEYGGQGWASEFQTIYNEVTSPFAWALPNISVTVGICAATLLELGTTEQKSRHLPAMLRGHEMWTQLLSEPGAGSDLASVSTWARREGPDYVLNGQKVWTSLAKESDYALAVVRTDRSSSGRSGLSMLIVDMGAAGIDVRPLREITGEALFNEVFLDEVHVPVANLVGEEGDGWPALLTMLGHERVALSAGTARGRMSEPGFDRLLRSAVAAGRDDDPDVVAVLARLWTRETLAARFGSRVRLVADSGVSVGPVGSIGKLMTAANARLRAETAAAIAGADLLGWSPGDDATPRLAHDILFAPMAGIAGGTTEIQKNTIAERLLGLPREPRGKVE